MKTEKDRVRKKRGGLIIGKANRAIRIRGG
jgi:hypothetical protein